MPFERHENPLLDFSGLARFGEIRPEHITPAIDELLGRSRAAVTRAGDPATAPTWEALVDPLDEALERLSRAWGVVSHLNAVLDTPALREQYNANLPKLTAFWCRALLGLPGYSGNPFRAHADVHERSSFTPAHFERWLSLFYETLELGWIGPRADRAAALAANVARVHSEQLIGQPVVLVS